MDYYNNILAGKKIRISGYESKKEGIWTFVLKNAEYSRSHFYLFSIENKMYHVSFVNLCECLVFKKINRVITEIDPYGEEDWQLESIDLSEKFIPIDIRMKYDPYLDLDFFKKFYDAASITTYPNIDSIIKMLDKIEFNKNEHYLNELKSLIRRNVKFTDYKGNQVTDFVKGVHYNIHGLIVFEYGTIYRTMIDETKFVQVIQSKQIFSEHDPYGEENWEDIWN